MSRPIQLEFPYASLDFPHRATLTAAEIAEKLGCTKRHIENQIEAGQIGDLNLASKDTSRRFSRVPIEEYRNFIIRRMSGEGRILFLAALPKSTLQELQNEITALMRRK